MNPTILFFSGLAAAITLTLSSCGDDKSSANESDDAEPSSAESANSYPLDVCVVSGEKLGSMGESHVITHEGTEVRFCCDACLPTFNKDPEKFVGMVKAGKVGATDHSKHGQ